MCHSSMEDINDLSSLTHPSYVSMIRSEPKDRCSPTSSTQIEPV